MSAHLIDDGKGKGKGWRDPPLEMTTNETEVLMQVLRRAGSITAHENYSRLVVTLCAIVDVNGCGVAVSGGIPFVKLGRIPRSPRSDDGDGECGDGAPVSGSSAASSMSGTSRTPSDDSRPPSMSDLVSLHTLPTGRISPHSFDVRPP
jgi:hypothetical protein